MKTIIEIKHKTRLSLRDKMALHSLAENYERIDIAKLEELTKQSEL
jgi:hypothetical protein